MCLKKIRTKKIYCAKCHTLLYTYHKAREGRLVKCFRENIKNDFTLGDLKCPVCGTEFARERMINGKPAYKIIQGKVYMK
ncbi:MAG: hypothetical protein EOM06_12205 [Sphingobacteriia bacterium]|nr:hypothetical protein [Sphingobacteriia bacterium]